MNTATVNASIIAVFGLLSLAMAIGASRTTESHYLNHWSPDEAVKQVEFDHVLSHFLTYVGTILTGLGLNRFFG